MRDSSVCLPSTRRGAYACRDDVCSFIDKRVERTNRLFWKRATDNGNERIETAESEMLYGHRCICFTPNYMSIYGPNVMLFMAINRSC